MRVRTFLILALSALLSTAACSQAIQSDEADWYYGYPEPGALEELGWDAEKLDQVREFVSTQANTTGLMVVDRGRIVFESGNVEELSYLASVRKSITTVREKESIPICPFTQTGTPGF